MIAAFSITGCNDQPTGETTDIGDHPPDTVVVDAGRDDHEGHAHPEHGPHDGDLIELGEEEYHSELVHDAESVAIYILDSAAEHAVPIDAAEVAINLKHDGKPEQFKLAAAPQDGDGEGKASKFTIKNADLVSHLDAEDGVLDQSRSTQRYERKPASDEASLVARMHELVRRHPRFGYRRMAVLLRREGFRAGFDRVYRLWRREGLKVPKTRRKKRRLGTSANGCVRQRVSRPNEVWAWDFIFDRTTSGTSLKWLSVIDEFTRECLCLSVCG